MKKLITDYSFNPNSGIVSLTGLSGIALENLLLITNVSSGQMIYSFADPTLGGSITGNNSIRLRYATSGVMSSGDRLQIFYDVPNERVDLASGYLTGFITGSGGSTGLFSRIVPQNFTAVGGRAVDMNTGFYPNYSRNADVILNMDKDSGGTLAYQADLDKDLDSVTNYDIGYASVSNFFSGLVTGTSSSGTGRQVISGNSNRITLFGQNLGTVPLIIKYGLGCNASSFNFVLPPSTALFDGRGGNFSDDRYKGDVSVNTLTSGSTGYYMFWEGV